MRLLSKSLRDASVWAMDRAKRLLHAHVADVKGSSGSLLRPRSRHWMLSEAKILVENYLVDRQSAKDIGKLLFA